MNKESVARLIDDVAKGRVNGTGLLDREQTWGDALRAGFVAWDSDYEPVVTEAGLKWLYSLRAARNTRARIRSAARKAWSP